MAQRIRTQRNRDAHSGNGGSSTSVATGSSRDHPTQAAAAAGGGGAGSKRKRDVLQDISEEHGGNGEPGGHQPQHASATSSRRSQQAPRRPSPMAPARRASVRRSRRLSEQQPSATSGRGGALARAAAASAAGGSGGNGGAGGAGAGRGEGEREGGDGDDDEGGMSCDEDLEGTVVDLSFEGVADDSVWRETDVATAPASSASSSSGASAAAPSHGGRGRGGAPGAGGNSPTSSRSSSNSSRGEGGPGGAGASIEGGGGSEGESGISMGSSSSGSSSRNTAGGAGSGDADRRTRRVRSRPCTSREKERQVGSGVGAGAADLRKSELAAADARALRDAAAARGSGLARGRREKRASLLLGTEQQEEANLSSAASSGHSAHPEASHTPPPSRAPAGRRTEHGGTSAGVAAVAGTGVELGVRTPLPAGVEDLDAGVWDEGDSHLLNPDYVAEHAAFLRVQEKRNRPEAYIGARQKDMRQSMRSVLVDWIVEVCDQFKVSSRTLFQVVDLIDRSLTAFEVPRGRLQLLGCACVVLASKYEEIYAPAAQELAHISDNTYTRAEIISMELVVVNALQFRLSCVTPCNFQDRFCRAARSNPRERSLVAYLLELMLQDYQGVTLLPSLKAAAALYLARQTLHPRGCGRVPWTKQTEYYTGYAPRALEACVRRLHSLHVRAEANNLHAVREKYSKQARHCAAEVTCALEDSLRFGDEGT